MNNIPNDVLQEIILNKVKLFTKENYFGYFSSILIKLSHNIKAFQKKVSLSISINSLQKEKIHTSWWQLITRLIFPLNKSLLYKDENEIENENEYESDLNPLCFEYLKNYCHKKMKQLSSLSQTERIPLTRILPMYLNLCEKQIKKTREKENGIYHLSKESLLKLKKNSFIINKQPPFVNRTQIKFSTKKNGGKNLPSVQQLEYCNSFTRLFIGDTDENSIMERYLSNMVVKKHRQLHLLNSYMDLPSMYLKRMYYKLFKKEGGKGIMDKDMIKVINQFENDHKKIENFQRSSSTEKGNQYDITKSQLLFELQYQKQKYIKKIPKKNNRKNKNMFNSSIMNNEISKIDKDLNINFKVRPIPKVKNQNSSVNYNDNKTIKDTLLINKDNMNQNKNNNKYNYIKNSYSLFKINNQNNGNKIKRINRSSSVFIMKNKNHNIFKNNSFLNENRKRKYFQNYMNNNDFFFSKA